MLHYRSFLLSGLLLTAFGACDTAILDDPPPPLLRFGAVADVQYCDCDYDETLHRDYRASIPKLNAAVQTLNAAYDRGEIAFSIHLGDLVDRDLVSFGPAIAAWRGLKHEAFLVPGNHELGATLGDYDLAVRSLGIDSPTGRGYYAFTVERAPGWRFLVLDGNDASLTAGSGSAERIRGDSLYSIALLRNPLSVYWNGALSNTQLAWLEAELDASVTAGERVVVFSHFPLSGTPGLDLWNGEEVLEILRRYENVLGFFGGHLHYPYTVSYDGPPQIGVPSILGDTHETGEYGIASIYPEFIRWDGQQVQLVALRRTLPTVPLLLWGTVLTGFGISALAHRRRPASG